MENHIYAPLWNKYRPVLLKLMVDSIKEPQQYKLFPHEFKNFNPGAKGALSFTLVAHKGKSLNNIKDSILAQDLLYVLEASKKALELMESNQYEFQLDKKFVLHITELKPSAATVTSPIVL